MPQSAWQIPAFFGSYKGEMLWFLTALSWVFALSAAFVLRRTVIRGEQTPFVMELPPYHLPTIRSVFRNAFERSWMYMKKAGTVILGVSVLLWAMMYFPQVDKVQFEGQRREAEAVFQQRLEEEGFEELGSLDAATLSVWVGAAKAGWSDTAVRQAAQEVPGAVEVLDAVTARSRGRQPQVGGAAEAVDAYLSSVEAIAAARGREQLMRSFAGRIGRALEPVTALAGFDWKDNVALLGGFAAKEVIVSTMGMAYSMGQIEPPEAGQEGDLPLVQALQRDPSWSALRAFSLIIFVMLYAPCLVTVVTIGRESRSWKWAVFSVCYSTVLAWGMATLVFRIGHFLGFGV